MSRRATFVIPGDLETLTGGYIYEKHVLHALGRVGWEVAYLRVPGGFPDASAKTVAAVGDALAALPVDQPVLLDGFLPGAMPPDELARLRAPFVAITHHPLGYEAGLSPERAAHLCETERANLARAAHIVVPSPHTRDTLIADFAVPAARITVASPGVLRSALREAPVAGSPMILAVGQLVPRKGHDALIDALDKLRDLDWRAVIVGKDHDPAHALELRAQTARARLSERIRFAGEVAPDALADLYNAATVFALATRYEGYGMVFAEALAHGLPIVTCAAGAVADTVPSSAGMLVPPDDPASMARALREVLTDDALCKRLADAALAHAETLPTWEDTARIIGTVLEQVQPYRHGC